MKIDTDTPSSPGEISGHPGDARGLFHALADAMRRGVLGTGDLAGLRRMDPRRLDAPGFWKLAGLYLDRVLPGEAEARRQAESAWGAITVALAHLGPLQGRDLPLGRVLAQVGYSEPRFVRLLRADEERLLDEVPQLARFLAARGSHADLADAALVLVGAEQTRENARRRLARDYYAALSAE